MEYTESITEIKRTATKIKKMLDDSTSTGQHAIMAIANANTQLNRIQGELALVERTLQQFATASAVKMGPTETK